jgi:hypothetical protein
MIISEDKWRPIETAPKDGRRIFLYGAAGFGETSSDVGYWDRDPEDECGQCWRDGTCERIEPIPTHWMPLPEPPTGQHPNPSGEDAPRPYRKIIAAIRRHVRELNSYKLNSHQDMALYHLVQLEIEIAEMKKCLTAEG